MARTITLKTVKVYCIIIYIQSHKALLAISLYGLAFEAFQKTIYTKIN